MAAPGTVQVAAHTAGVAGHRCDPGETGQPVGAAVAAHVAGGGGEQLGAHHWAAAGHGLDHFGEAVLAKPGRNELVDRTDAR